MGRGGDAVKPLRRLITQSDAAEEVGARPSLSRLGRLRPCRRAAAAAAAIFDKLQALSVSDVAEESPADFTAVSFSSLRRSLHESKQNSLRMTFALWPNH